MPFKLHLQKQLQESFDHCAACVGFYEKIAFAFLVNYNNLINFMEINNDTSVSAAVKLSAFSYFLNLKSSTFILFFICCNDFSGLSIQFM